MSDEDADEGDVEFIPLEHDEERNRHRVLYPTISLMEDDVESHGEVHAVVEEMDAEVEVRQGTAVFDYDHEVITLDGRSHPIERIGFDRVVSWYLPQEPRH